jgi:hypothetical protein
MPIFTSTCLHAAVEVEFLHGVSSVPKGNRGLRSIIPTKTLLALAHGEIAWISTPTNRTSFCGALAYALAEVHSTQMHTVAADGALSRR